MSVIFQGLTISYFEGLQMKLLETVPKIDLRLLSFLVAYWFLIDESALILKGVASLFSTLKNASLQVAVKSSRSITMAIFGELCPKTGA